MRIIIPGFGDLNLKHLVLDYNGTIATDGAFLEEIRRQLNNLAETVTLHILTADTHGSVKDHLRELPCVLRIIGNDKQDEEKWRYVKELGSKEVVAIGNGRNDALMLGEACLGVGVMHVEGCSSQIMAASDVLCRSTEDALNLLLHPSRLIATLRN